MLFGKNLVLLSIIFSAFWISISDGIYAKPCGYSAECSKHFKCEMGVCKSTTVVTRESYNDKRLPSFNINRAAKKKHH